MSCNNFSINSLDYVIYCSYNKHTHIYNIVIIITFYMNNIEYITCHLIQTIYWLTKLQIHNVCSFQHSACLTERGEGSSLQLEMSDVGSAELHCGILHPSFCCCHNCSRFPPGRSLGLRESVTSICTLLSGPKIFSLMLHILMLI